MRLLLINFVLVSSLAGYAQTTTHLTDSNTKRNSIYMEVFGMSDIYALNFERTLSENYSIRLGISWLPGTWQLNGNNNRSFFYLPLEWNRIYGTKQHRIQSSSAILTQLIYNVQSPNQYVFNPRLGISYVFKKKRLYLRTGVCLNIPLYLSADSYETFFYTKPNWLVWPQFAFGTNF